MAPWSNTPNGTMKAAVLKSPGAFPPSSCFEISTNYPEPSLPSPEWLLVRIKAFGLNRAELRGRNNEAAALPEYGMYQSEYTRYYGPDPAETPAQPAILGEEFVGLVEDLGLVARSKGFTDGDAVTGFVYGGGKAYDGSYAEYTICHVRRCWKLPKTNLPWHILGAIPMSMWTAWGSLFEAAQLQKGQTLLIHGGSSSVGVWAAYLALDIGCTVITTTRSSDKVDKLKMSGVQYVLLEAELEDQLPIIAPRGADAILELVGPSQLESFSLNHLARRGTVVVTGVLDKGWRMNNFTPLLIPPTRKITHYVMTDVGLGSRYEDEGMDKVGDVLKQVVERIESGAFRQEVFLDSVFALEEIGKAHEWMEESKATGKVVVVVA